MKQLWYKNAVIYAVDVSTFQDSNDDGIGDFPGLTKRLDHLAYMGVDCIWVLPFFPSPRRDNGYDVTNYVDIDPRFGTFDDFRKFIKRADELEIRVLIDLVVHHTSDRHPWFEAARSDRTSKYRDYYIWSDDLPSIKTEKSFFPEVESGVWRYDPISESYYRHGFYHFQPDLNFANPHVRQEVFNIVDFWLSYGISGFRIDAANWIMGLKGLPGTEVKDPGAFWKKIHDFIRKRREDAALLVEADMEKEEIPSFVLGGKGVQMLKNFWGNQTMLYALASEKAQPLLDTLNELPVMPTESQYVNFLRNLDEANIERLTTEEQDVVYRKFGAKKTMQVYGRGIRRRLAPMLKGNIKQLKMAHSLLFSMPGAPLIPYGDEIGMGDNLKLQERDAVRVPMQWANEPYGGFSTTDVCDIVDRRVREKQFHYRRVNVAAQKNDSDSLLNCIKKLIELRKKYPIVGASNFEALVTDRPDVVALKVENGNARFISFHNLSSKACIAKLKIPAHLKGLKEVMSDSEYEAPSDGLRLEAYGWRWFTDGR